ncbi:MAG: glycosyltransferase family 2 protein [Elusimicrobia bacterium]|nr:glycosyltransferase family 2 protein [Elusimicrobiota bacterium]
MDLNIYSVVIPVYKNEESLPELLEALRKLDLDLQGALEAVFVVDGSPDRSLEVLKRELPREPFSSRLLVLSRNFGSFAAIRAGLAEGSGPLFAVMAADLQEPPELLLRFHQILREGATDVVVGTRESREDPWPARTASRLFWWLYRTFIDSEMPPGGVDVFACTAQFKDCILSLNEANSTLVGLIFWVGFRRMVVGYRRRARSRGRSAWTLGRRMKYFFDSVFAFSDLPVRILMAAGLLSFLVSVVFALVVAVDRWVGAIPVPGYAATVVTILFFAGLNALGLGLIGSYVWRTFENTKQRPASLVLESTRFGGQRA